MQVGVLFCPQESSYSIIGPLLSDCDAVPLVFIDVDCKGGRRTHLPRLADKGDCGIPLYRDQQVPVPAQVIDKGIPTAGLLAHVMIAKFADHLPLYRQESIFGRAGLVIPRSTLAQWIGVTGVQVQPLVDALRDVVLGQQVIHADETLVQMLVPANSASPRSAAWPMRGVSSSSCTRPTRACSPNSPALPR